MQAIEKYFPLVLFMMLYKVVVTFECDRVTAWPCDRVTVFECGGLNESFWAVLSCGTVYHAVQKSVSEILKCDYLNESF